MALHPTDTMPPGSAPAMPLAGGAQPMASVRGGGGGTGVFLPRTEPEVVVRRTVKAAIRPPPRNGKHVRVIHQRGGQQAVAMAILKAQQEMRAVAAAHMERTYYYLGVHPRPELALPLEWTY